jgi:hypothetical protein
LEPGLTFLKCAVLDGLFDTSHRTGVYAVRVVLAMAMAMAMAVAVAVAVAVALVWTR